MPQASASGRPLRPADTRLVVLRHGVTDHNARGVWQGHLDTELSAHGRAQAYAAAQVLTRYEPALVLSSDLQRARQTAEVVATACGLSAEYDRRLREINAGAWQGLSAHEVAERFPGVQEAVAAGEDLRRGGDGETLAEVAQRATAAARDVAARLAHGGLAVIVTHGVSARALVAGVVGLDQRSAWLGLAGLGNCAWAELREHDGRWRLYTWNVVAPGTGDVQDAWQSAY